MGERNRLRGQVSFNNAEKEAQKRGEPEPHDTHGRTSKMQEGLSDSFPGLIAWPETRGVPVQCYHRCLRGMSSTLQDWLRRMFTVSLGNSA